jgi:hypothetical protein
VGIPLSTPVRWRRTCNWATIVLCFFRPSRRRGATAEAARRHFFIGRELTKKGTAEPQFRQAQNMESIGQLTGASRRQALS